MAYTGSAYVDMDYGNGVIQRILISEMDTAISNYMQYETALIVNGEGGHAGARAASPEIKKYFEKLDSNITDYVTQRLAASTATSILESLIENNYFDVERSFKSTNAGDLARETGGFWGEFIEGSFLNIPKNTDPRADIQEVLLEVKGLLGIGSTKHSLHIGDITVQGIDTVDKNSPDILNTITFYKMIIKMANFLLINIEPKTLSTGRHRMTFRAITLYMVLLLKKLWDDIYKHMQGVQGDLVKVEAKPWKQHPDGTTSKLYKVGISLAMYAESYKFAELYLIHHNILDDIKSTKAMRGAFWTGIKNLRMSYLGGEEPEWNFAVVPNKSP